MEKRHLHGKKLDDYPVDEIAERNESCERNEKNYLSSYGSSPLPEPLFSTAWAENLNTAVKTTLDVSTLEVKDVDQTVALTIEMEKDIVIDGFGGQLYWPQEIKLTSISNEELGLTGATTTLQTESLAGVLPMRKSELQVYYYGSFTVPANTTAGTYEIGVKDLEITCDYGTPYDDAKALAASSTLTISGGVTPPAHTHDLKKVDAKAATCTEAGNKEYWECKTCGNFYWDADGKDVITNKMM